jgi:GT2 family glycosyltransferase
VPEVPQTTIVVLSVDEGPLLERSLPAAVRQPDATVLVVDNACTDATARVAEAHGARRLALARRTSYAAALNAGLTAADGDLVALVNADCVLDAGFLDAARAPFADPAVGSVAPKLIRARGMDESERLAQIDAAGMVVDRRRKNALVGHGAPAEGFATRAPAFGGDGAAVVYRRRVLEDCALEGEILDEDFELWAADVDLAWRARLLGWECVFEPAAVAWHVRFYSPSTRARLDARHRRLQFRNRYLMMLKNDTPAGLARDLHRIAAYEVLALGYALAVERELLRGYAEALRLAPAALRRRRAIQRERRRRRGRAAPVPFGLEPPA